MFEPCTRLSTSDALRTSPYQNSIAAVRRVVVCRQVLDAAGVGEHVEDQNAVVGVLVVDQVVDEIAADETRRRR